MARKAIQPRITRINADSRRGFRLPQFSVVVCNVTAFN